MVEEERVLAPCVRFQLDHGQTAPGAPSRPSAKSTGDEPTALRRAMGKNEKKKLGAGKKLRRRDAAANKMHRSFWMPSHGHLGSRLRWLPLLLSISQERNQFWSLLVRWRRLISTEFQWKVSLLRQSLLRHPHLRGEEFGRAVAMLCPPP